MNLSDHPDFLPVSAHDDWDRPARPAPPMPRPEDPRPAPPSGPSLRPAPGHPKTSRSDWIQQRYDTAGIHRRMEDLPGKMAAQRTAVSDAKRLVKEAEGELQEQRVLLAADVTGPNKEARENELARRMAEDQTCRDIRGSIATLSQDVTRAEIELQRMEQEFGALHTRARLIGHELAAIFNPS